MNVYLSFNYLRVFCQANNVALLLQKRLDSRKSLAYLPKF